MTPNRLGLSNAVDADTARSATKLMLGATSLLFVGYLVTLLPGLDRFVPRTPVTIAALVSAVVTVLLVALLVFLAPKLASLTRMALDGPQSIVENLASVVYWVVVLVAVLVAHSGLAALVTPWLADLEWLYDVGFLLLALPAVAVVAARLYDTLDPTADLVAARMGEQSAETDDATRTDDSDEEGGTAGRPYRL